MGALALDLFSLQLQMGIYPTADMCILCLPYCNYI